MFGGGISGILTVGDGILLAFFCSVGGSQAWAENRIRFSIRFSMRTGARTAMRTCLAVFIREENRLVRTAHEH